MDLVTSASGLAVGIVVGLTGVGGGSLMAPIMMLVFGIAPATAVGTDLWFAAITKVFGAWVHGRKGTIDWQVLRRLAYGSIPASMLTLYWLHASGAAKGSGAWMTKTLGAMLIVSSIAALSRARAHALGKHLRETQPVPFKATQPVLTVLAGAVVGCLVTLTSIGAGALGAIMLLYLYPRRLTPSALVGTDIAHAIPLTLLAGTGHALLGNVNIELLLNLLVGSIPGIVLGSLAATRAPANAIRVAIAIVLAAVGVKMLA